MDDELSDRIGEVLGDAEALLDEGGASRTDELHEVAETASGLVDEADSVALLKAVGLTDDDGEADYASVPEALAKGDPDRVLDLERLLRLSKLARIWEDDEAEDLIEDLPDLFATAADADAGDETDAAETAEASDEAEGEPAEVEEPVEVEEPAEAEGAREAGEETDEGDDGDALPDSIDGFRDALDRTTAVLSGFGSDEGEEEGEAEDDEEDGDGDDGGLTEKISDRSSGGRSRPRFSSAISTVPSSKRRDMFSTMSPGRNRDEDRD
ncbi:hypothetical protein [Halomarina pelagica]|uniref:hypothetical protein n=1 Tax=Halomarina pelagica TaxID=2961599 RepID=UPI0020C377DB|nr:hypothetical protein [Halomarina sp. BND7]